MITAGGYSTMLFKIACFSVLYSCGVIYPPAASVFNCWIFCSAVIGAAGAGAGAVDCFG